MSHQEKTLGESVRQSGLPSTAVAAGRGDRDGFAAWWWLGAAAFAAAMLYWASTIKGAVDVSLDDATWVLAFLTGVLAFSVPLSIREATRKQEDARRTQESANAQFYEQQQMRFYAQLDAIYLDIQKLIIQHPFLARPDGPRTADQEVQYQAFAFVVWNFIESIDDYDAELRGREAESPLKKTWGSIMRLEAMQHARWFQDRANEGKFKSDFRQKMMGDLEKWGAITA